jgi:hypothetical protein
MRLAIVSIQKKTTMIDIGRVGHTKHKYLEKRQQSKNLHVMYQYRSNIMYESQHTLDSFFSLIAAKLFFFLFRRRPVRRVVLTRCLAWYALHVQVRGRGLGSSSRLLSSALAPGRRHTALM